MQKLLRTAVGTLIAIALTAGLVEVMYRYYLSNIVAGEVARAFKPTRAATFHAYGVPPWKFSRQLGFEFNPGPWRTAVFTNGVFEKCDMSYRGNRFGNYGDAPDDYESADVKIMIVGSSYTMIKNDLGAMIDGLLAERLSGRTKKKVRVLNYSRDATGILSNLDIVADKIDEVRPDIILALVNVTALTYQRHWRTVRKDKDGFHRMYFLHEPDEASAGLPGAMLQRSVLSDSITDDWCERMNRQAENRTGNTTLNDPVSKSLVARHWELQRDMAVPAVLIDFWRLDTSFVINVLMFGEPFKGMSVFGEQQVNNPSTLQNFTDDSGFNEAIARIKKSGVPIIFSKLPTLPEMKIHPDGGYEFAAHSVPARQGASLAASLEQATGEPFIHLYKYYAPTHKADPQLLVSSATDSHPSPLGVDAMAEALERFLFEHPRTAPLLTGNKKAGAQ